MKNVQHHIAQEDIFSADQIIGKTLIAKKKVPLTRSPKATAPIIWTAQPDESVGVVYSWVMEGTTLWWLFYDKYNVPYYAMHKPGIFSVTALQQQGAQTVEEIKEAKEAAENPLMTAISKMFKPVIWAAAAFFIIKAFRSEENK